MFLPVGEIHSLVEHLLNITKTWSDYISQPSYGNCNLFFTAKYYKDCEEKGENDIAYAYVHWVADSFLHRIC